MKKIDVNNDVVMVYHRDGQAPKAVIPVRDLIISANYFAGGVAGSYKTVVQKYKKNLPDDIIVYGNLTGRRYRFVGDRATNPENELYSDQGVSDNWVDLDRVANLNVLSRINKLERSIELLEQKIGNSI